MARLKSAIPGRGGSAGGIPEQLRSRLHPMWQDDDAIGRFIVQHALEVAGWRGPLTAFYAVAETYAIAQGWVTAHDRADLHALRAAGVPMLACALESRKRRIAIYPDHRITDADWEFIAGAELRNLRGS